MFRFYRAFKELLDDAFLHRTVHQCSDKEAGLILIFFFSLSACSLLMGRLTVGARVGVMDQDRLTVMAGWL